VRAAARSFARRRYGDPVFVAPPSITASTGCGRGELLSYWSSRAGGLPGVTRRRCSRLARQSGNKQQTDNSQNCPWHCSLRGLEAAPEHYSWLSFQAVARSMPERQTMRRTSLDTSVGSFCVTVIPRSYDFIARCPTCDTRYAVVRVEASPKHERQLPCLSCGGPLRNREGRHVLKYFRTSDRAELRKNGREPKLR
jgi:hypothetical protein